MSFYDKLKFDANGLIPAIIQEQKTGRVVMMAWMNRASLEKTIVAGRADLLDLDQQRVAVAIKRDVFHGLRVAAGLALHPELLARAAPEMGLAGGEGGLERGAVHPRHHQHAPGGLLLDDRGDEAVGVEFQLVVEAHEQWGVE